VGATCGLGSVVGGSVIGAAISPAEGRPFIKAGKKPDWSGLFLRSGGGTALIHGCLRWEKNERRKPRVVWTNPSGEARAKLQDESPLAGWNNKVKNPVAKALEHILDCRINRMTSGGIVFGNGLEHGSRKPKIVSQQQNIGICHRKEPVHFTKQNNSRGEQH